ncbi:hypothetical protein ACEN32_06995 [Marinilactibacillus psychrotolerans]|uniref:hypothetical protein n=1 Tax=Marinilactibacillus psychrotolerans TaxID=191770 RepID=UPI0038884978
MESKDLFAAPEENKIIGIESNAIPYFEKHEPTTKLIALVPKNSTKKAETEKFFEEQGMILQFQKSE